jgi:hypothetical protein
VGLAQTGFIRTDGPSPAGPCRGSLSGQGCRHVNRRGFRRCRVGDSTSHVPVPVGPTRDTYTATCWTAGVRRRIWSDASRRGPCCTGTSGPALPSRGPPGGSVRHSGPGGPEPLGAGLVGAAWVTYWGRVRQSAPPRTARCQSPWTVLHSTLLGQCRRTVDRRGHRHQGSSG